MSAIPSWPSAYPGMTNWNGATPVSAASALSKGQKAAQDFEAQLIATVLQSLEKTFADLPGQDAIAGQDDYNYLGNQALAKGLVEGGGFGIAQMIGLQLEGSKGAAHPAAAPGEG